MEYYRSVFFPSTTMVVFWVVALVLAIAGMWRIFEKAGQPGWACIVPIYNAIVFLRIIGKPVWWILLFIIPYFNIVFIIWAYNMLSKSFGKGIGYTLGFVFLGFIFIPVLGFSDAVYLGPGGAPINYGAGDYQKPFDINPEV